MPTTAKDSQSPLLPEDTVDGSVDHKGRPANRPTSGRWRSAYFIIGAEIAERYAFYGVQANLINYLTDRLGQSVPVAAKNVNTWFGTVNLLPLLGASLADSYLGRYATIVMASMLYILGLGLLTTSVMLPAAPRHSRCQKSNESTSGSPPQIQIIFFFFSLYLVAVGVGGHKPCIHAFGADQFDGRNQVECIAKSSFFNWWSFGVFTATVLTQSLSTYIQDNLNWGLGFGIPCIVMILGLLLFLLGARTYRYNVEGHGRSPFMRIGQVFISAAKNCLVATTSVDRAGGSLHQLDSHDQLKFLNKALLAQDCSKGNGSRQCTIDDVEEAKAVLRLFPIGATCLTYAVVYAQSSTFFTKQGITMDRSIGSGFVVPAASLQSFSSIAVVLSIPIYDLILVPTARTLTRKPSGITMLQRIGAGMFLSVVVMVIAALVEMKRLETAREHGLIDMPNVTVPMRIWWLLPQYILFGVANVFTVVGLQEFFYDQVPTDLRSVGVALSHCIFGVGSFLSSFLISVIEKATGGDGDGDNSWFNDNLNRAHLDYYYWAIAGVSAIGLSLYLYFAESYIYNRRGVS